MQNHSVKYDYQIPPNLRFARPRAKRNKNSKKEKQQTTKNTKQQN